jgi:translation initiation factor IF-3
MVPFQQPDQKQAMINERISAREVLLISSTGEKLGIINTKEALQKAKNDGLDLVLVAETSKPPVCKIMDYNKLIYEQKKREKKNESHGKVEIKELRFGICIQDHDLQIKAKQAKEFLEKGWRVKLSVQFSGREKQHPELGIDVLNRFIKFVGEDKSKFENQPRLEGRYMNTYLLKK